MPSFTTITMFCLVWLYAPLIIMMVYAFNSEQSVTRMHGFSLRWFEQAATNRYVQDATLLSLKVALVATVIATIAATMAALATTRTRPFRGNALVYAVINQPLMIPEIVTAVGTLVFFGLIKQFTGVHGIGYLMHKNFILKVEIHARSKTCHDDFFSDSENVKKFIDVNIIRIHTPL